jgi:hypothetical protein
MNLFSGTSIAFTFDCPVPMDLMVVVLVLVLPLLLLLLLLLLLTGVDRSEVRCLQLSKHVEVLDLMRYRPFGLLPLDLLVVLRHPECQAVW